MLMVSISREHESSDHEGIASKNPLGLGEFKAVVQDSMIAGPSAEVRERTNKGGRV
jgi:hypothetical protein